VPQRPDDTVVPALNLWSRRSGAHTLLNLRGPAQVYEFFRAYCRVLMRGPIEFYARWGMAFEPHLQNVHIALRGGEPSRIVLRDLDSTILDAARVRPALRKHGLAVAAGTWRHMPSIETGGRRLTQAMLYGHLGPVMSYLVCRARVDLAKLAGAVDDTWDELIADASSPSVRRAMCELRATSNTVKAALHTRLARSARFAFR
jgi:siderophore synthetase component